MCRAAIKNNDFWDGWLVHKLHRAQGGAIQSPLRLRLYQTSLDQSQWSLANPSLSFIRSSLGFGNEETQS